MNYSKILLVLIALITTLYSNINSTASSATNVSPANTITLCAKDFCPQLSSVDTSINLVFSSSNTIAPETKCENLSCGRVGGDSQPPIPIQPIICDGDCPRARPPKIFGNENARENSEPDSFKDPKFEDFKPKVVEFNTLKAINSNARFFLMLIFPISLLIALGLFLLKKKYVKLSIIIGIVSFVLLVLLNGLNTIL